MTTAADQLDDTPSPTDLQQFVYLANNVFEHLETAKRELERDREAAKASLAAASSILQSEIERRSRKGARPGALAAWQIARVRAFIDENLHRTIHAKDLSAVAQRSTAHFSRSFKQVFGEPPHAYVVRRRLERACHLMITSSASLSEIALSVGFSDQAHLCKLFRQAFGQSPSSWRRDRTAIARAEIEVTGAVQPFEKEYFRKDGSRVPVLIGSAAFDEQRDQGVALFDLTERKRAEEAFRKVQMQLAHANRVATMGQLSASITHEVKQPITAAVTYALAARRWLSAEPPNFSRGG
jgi:AraC family transcriptional regulator